MADGRNRRFRGLLNSGRRGGGLLAGPVMASGPTEEQIIAQKLAAAPSAPQRSQVEPERRRGVSGWRVFDRVLGGQTVTEALDAERARPMQEFEAQRAMRRAKLEDGAFEGLLGMFGGMGGGQGPMPGGGAGGAASQGGLPTLRGAAPALAAAELLGVDGAGGLRQLLTELRPDIQVDSASGRPYDSRDPATLEQTFARPEVVNGEIVNLSAPDAIGRRIPEVPEGFELLRDSQGNPRIVPIPGYIEGQRDLEGGIAGARTAATAPIEAAYDMVTIPGPNGPVSLPRSQAIALGAIEGTDTSTLNARETRNEEDMAAVAALRENNARFGYIVSQLGYSLDENGRAVPIEGAEPAFRLTPADAARYELDLALGRNNPEAAAYANYLTEIQSVVNESLRLNTGPQTDQDARREAEGILRNRNNLAYVVQRLPRLMQSNARRARAIEQRRAQRSGQGQSQRAPVTVQTPAEAQALPPGTIYRTPDGQEYRR